jgi:hypothetical protein
LVKVKIASVGVLHAVLGHEGRSTNTTANETFTVVENTLSQLSDTLLAISITVSRPERLSKSGSTRPELAVDSGIIVLLRPEWGNSTEDVLSLLSSETNSNIVVINALPCLVGSAPRTAITTIVITGRRVGSGGVSGESIRNASSQRRRVVDVVTGIVGDPATET